MRRAFAEYTSFAECCGLCRYRYVPGRVAAFAEYTSFAECCGLCRYRYVDGRVAAFAECALSLAPSVALQVKID